MSDETYRGQQITLTIRDKRCIHSRNCVLALPSVFVPNADGEWVFPDSGNVEAVVACASSCPSGAIVYERTDGGQNETAPAVNTVRIRENGPLAFHADLDVGGDTSAFRATLCRCGASRNKPYCDGSHNENGFEATGEPLSTANNPLDRRNGPLKVSLAPNGPLVISGALEVCSGTGRTVVTCTQTALCRCGHSANKPFCDGSHNRVKFDSSR